MLENQSSFYIISNALSINYHVTRVTTTTKSCMTDQIFPRALFTLGSKHVLQGHKRVVGKSLKNDKVF